MDWEELNGGNEMLNRTGIKAVSKTEAERLD